MNYFDIKYIFVVFIVLLQIHLVLNNHYMLYNLVSLYF